jgi:hypothetical protein
MKFRNLKSSGKNTGKNSGLNLSCLLAIVSVSFCWFYGLPPLVAGFFSVRNLMRLKKGKSRYKSRAAFKLKWGYILAWIGLGFSGIFTVYYIIAFVSGAFVRI